MIVNADGRLIMTVLPADRLLDLEKVKATLGSEDVRLATEDEFAPIFDDCQRGAEPPFGNLYGLPMLVDIDLTTEELTFNAGYAHGDDENLHHRVPGIGTPGESGTGFVDVIVRPDRENPGVPAGQSSKTNPVGFSGDFIAG